MRFVLFLLFPALELYLLVKLGGVIGALNTLAWVVASALIGIWAVRAQGQSALLKARAEMEAGRVPQTPFLDGLLLFLGGILLILPGFMTDAAGLLLLIPPVRLRAAFALTACISSRQTSGTGSGARIFFFGSGGFSRAGAPPRDPFTRHGPERSVHYEPQTSDQAPRQATIIESTAIAMEKPASRDDPQSGNSSGSKD